jgi:DNA repair protein RadA/Sms
VLYLEGDKYGQYRFLRCRKNRFGSTDEVSIFEMGLFGLQPVYDLKERIINAANTSIPGSVLTVGIDNGRPVLISLEVLLNKTYGKFPQRIAQ